MAIMKYRDESSSQWIELDAKDADTVDGKHASELVDKSNLSSQLNGKGASLVGVEDSSGNFTSTNVEGVLDELFTFADNGKTNIASVVGSPATASDTFNQLQTIIQNQKDTLATNLTNKGTSASGTESLKSLADKVANVETGDYSVGDTVSTGNISPQHSSQLWAFTGHTDTVYAVAVDSSDYVYSGGNDATAKKIDSNGNEVWTFTRHEYKVYSIAVDSDGYVYTGGFGGMVKKSDPNGNEVWTFDHGGSVYSVAVDSNGNVYSGSSDDTVKKIDSNGNEVWTFSGHTGSVESVAVDSNGNVYSGSSDDTVKKIDSNGNEVWTFSGHTSWVISLHTDSDGYVYSASWDGTAKKIDSNGNEVWTFIGHTDNVSAIAVDSVGYVYSGGWDDTVRKIDRNPEILNYLITG